MWLSASVKQHAVHIHWVTGGFRCTTFPGLIMMHLSLCSFGSGAVLQLAEQMTSVDVVGNRCGFSCMADVLPKLVVTVLSCYNTPDVEKQEWTCVWCGGYEELVCSHLLGCPAMVTVAAFNPVSYSMKVLIVGFTFSNSSQRFAKARG